MIFISGYPVLGNFARLKLGHKILNDHIFNRLSDFFRGGMIQHCSVFGNKICIRALNVLDRNIAERILIELGSHCQCSLSVEHILLGFGNIFDVLHCYFRDLVFCLTDHKHSDHKNSNCDAHKYKKHYP